MKNIQTLFILVIIIGLSSCTYKGRIPADNLRIYKRTVPEYQKGQSLNIINYYKKSTVVPFTASKGKYGGGFDIEYDLQIYSNTAVKLVTQGVEHQSVYVTDKAKKSVTLRVTQIIPEMGFSSYAYDIVVNVVLSNGESFEVNTKKSGIGKTLIKASEKILQNPKFVKFMN